MQRMALNNVLWLLILAAWIYATAQLWGIAWYWGTLFVVGSMVIVGIRSRMVERKFRKRLRAERLRQGIPADAPPTDDELKAIGQYVNWTTGVRGAKKPDLLK